MTVSFELDMQPRAQLGKTASRRLRRLEGKVPAILYGGNEPPLTLSVDHSLLTRVLQNDAFYSSILNIKVGENVYRAVLKDLHRDPVKPKVLHLDLLRISETSEISLSVPLHFEGAHIAPGVKQGGGMVSYQLTSVEIQCLPQYLPEAIIVDISKLGLNEPITLSKLNLPEGVSLAKGSDRVVVTILAPRGQSAATAMAGSESTTEAAAS
jgi:large subunit ribosomal protein L25